MPSVKPETEIEVPHEQPERVYRPARRPDLTPHQLSLLILALGYLKVPETGGISGTSEAREVFQVVEKLRQRYIPGYNAGYWNRMVKQHGYHAFCAVIETTAMILGRIPRDDDDPIRSPHGYLGGIFRKSTRGEDMRPDMTLDSWVEIEKTALKTADDEASRAKREARIVEHQDLTEAFLEAAERYTTPYVIDCYFKHVVLQRRTAEAVILKVPARFVREQIKSEYMAELCAAWSMACGQSVFVKL